MKILFFALLLVAFIAIMALIMTIPFMLIWNALMPDIFGLPEIGLLQSFGLLVLSGMLFKSSSMNTDKD